MTTNTRFSDIPPVPEKLSILWGNALDDMQKCHEDPMYQLDYSRWHEGQPHGICTVCTSGSVMAKTLNMPHDADADPWGHTDPNIESLIPEAWSMALLTLDHLRTGDMDAALETFVEAAEEFDCSPTVADTLSAVWDDCFLLPSGKRLSDFSPNDHDPSVEVFLAAARRFTRKLVALGF